MSIITGGAEIVPGASRPVEGGQAAESRPTNLPANPPSGPPGPAAEAAAPAPSAASVPAAPWRESLKRAVRDPDELCRLLQLPAAWAAEARRAAGDFPLLTPRGFVARMKVGDPHDPLLRQVLPLDRERESTPGFSFDPLHETTVQPQPGLLHKYQGRVLLVATGACAVHCRYCFRRHFPYSDLPAGGEGWHAAVAATAADPSIREVLLSGGDPLTIGDDRLASLAARLAAIPHLRRLRIHSRLPIVLPERVDESLLSWLTGTRLKPVMVVHANHPNELDSAVLAAFAQLRAAGVLLFNQAVLLRGVNDSTDVLAELCEMLIDHGVGPYYLHQLDRVAGAAHFEVPVEEGRRIVEELRRRLPGYAVPRYVEERPGEASKSPLA